MNTATNSSQLPFSVQNPLNSKSNCIDNLFADAWKSLKINQKIQQLGFRKRTGLGISETVFLLLVWKWIHTSSIHLFSRHALQNFFQAGKDVMYDLLKRPDIHWRNFNLSIAREVQQQTALQQSQYRAWVLDDSIRVRRGKKMDGVSSHFDHTTGRHVMGEQVLTLGLATESAFLPLDSEIFISQTKAQPLQQPFKDKRSIAAGRYRDAVQLSKPDMADQMLKRAARHQLSADYLVADAWFGTKRMMCIAKAQKVTGLFRMKKNQMKYCVSLNAASLKPQMMTLQEMHHKLARHQWRKVPGLPWYTCTLEVDIDLSEQGNTSDWHRVKLVFVRGEANKHKESIGKKDWAVFLSTDPEISSKRALEVYALRWSIEVYFKEAKQHLGFLQEQTRNFASHIASIHLTAIRYLILVYHRQESDFERPGAVRSALQEQMNLMVSAGQLWAMFRAVISQALEGISGECKGDMNRVMAAIDEKIAAFFVQSLQLDTFTLEMESTG
jgi:SRSO17 transposase